MGNQMDIWAVTEWGKPLEKVQQPIPEPKGTEVLIEVTHCGVCHSDLHLWDGFFDFGGGKIFRIKDYGVTLPRALGHEIIGKVAKLGPQVEESVPVGASRIVYPWFGCQNCRRCAAGDDNMCTAQQSLGMVNHGGFASHVVVPHPKYLSDPGDLDPLVACTFGCSGITTLSAVSKVMPQDPNDFIVLVGAGGLGLAAISILKAKGHKKILSVDIGDDKLEAAKKAGATEVVNSKTCDAVKKIIELAGGPVQAAIDFVNNTATATMINGILGKGGIWVPVGIMGGSFELSLGANVFKAIEIKHNLVGNPAHLEEVVRMAKEGVLPPIPVTSMPWDEAAKALDLLRDGKVIGRLVLVKPDNNRSIADQFTAEYVELVKAATDDLSDSQEVDTKLGPSVDKKQFERVKGMEAQGKNEAELVADSVSHSETGGSFDCIVFLNPKADAGMYKSEIFSPVAIIEALKMEEEGIGLANDPEYGPCLGCSLRTSRGALGVLALLDSGVVGVNFVSVMNDQVRFGGREQSGIGRECDIHALRTYTEPKTILINMTAWEVKFGGGADAFGRSDVTGRLS